MLRIVGDVHGKFRDYVKKIEDAEYSLQLGDMGFLYQNMQFEKQQRGLSSENHKFFGGNHDNYDTYYDTPDALGDFGLETINGVTFFYVRGGFSLDWEDRVELENFTGFKSWWKEEQLDAHKRIECVHTYASLAPDLVITHAAPESVAKAIGNPGTLRFLGFDPDTFTTNTQKMLQTMLEIHKPKKWIFGHFHMSRQIELDGVQFQCLNELECIDLSCDIKEA